MGGTVPREGVAGLPFVEHVPITAYMFSCRRELEFKRECVCTRGQSGWGLDEQGEALEEESLAAPIVPEIAEYVLAIDARECPAVDGDGEF